MHVLLLAEHQRCLSRTQAMLHAQQGDFASFCQVLSADFFRHERAVEGLQRHQRDVLPAFVYKRFPSLDEEREYQRFFGIAHMIVEGSELWFSGPVVRCPSPGVWTDYTGQPRYCTPELWFLRAWANARGSLDHMGTALLSRLYELEGRHEWQYHSIQVSEGRWEYALLRKREALPSAAVWYNVCLLEPERVLEIEECIYNERSEAGVHWHCGRWCVDVPQVLV